MHDRLRSALRTELGDRAFDAAWSAGAARPLEHVVAEAQRLAD